MPHQFASIDCKECGIHYCPACKEICPTCQKDGIADPKHREMAKQMRLISKARLAGKTTEPPQDKSFL